MPFDDDADDDALVSGAPLPPDDRLWRHPSELAALRGGPSSAAAGDTQRPTALWSVALVSALVGAVLTVGIVAVTGNLESTTDRPAVEKVSGKPLAGLLVSDSIPAAGAGAVARTLAPSLARVASGESSSEKLGTAVIFRDDGYLLTVADLVQGADTVVVTLADGTDLPATVVGTDPYLDLAVLRVDRQGLTVATLELSGTPQVGDQVYAAGVRPSGHGDPLVTSGVVSVADEVVTGRGTNALHGMIQTDVPIAAETAGGALVDVGGAVLGLVAAVPDKPAFAVPTAAAKRAADDIITVGRSRHVWLGVEARDLDAATAKSMQVAGGAAVSKVVDGSPAATAGLKDGDVITALGGHEVTSMSSLLVGLRDHAPGDTVEVQYWREGKQSTCTATLVEKTS